MCTHSGRGLHSPRPTIGCLAHGQGSRELTRPKMSVSVAERHLTGTAGSKQLHHPRGDVLGPRQLGAVCHSATKPTRGELGLQDFDLGNRIERVWGCTGACSEWCDQTFRSPPYTLLSGPPSCGSTAEECARRPRDGIQTTRPGACSGRAHLNTRSKSIVRPC